jgi:hypothetical protein
VLHDLRPKLHRYCTRLTGSVIGGEDIVNADWILTHFDPQSAQIAIEISSEDAVL